MTERALPEQARPERNILSEIRHVRHLTSEKINHDPNRIVAYYAELQRSLAARVIDLSGEKPKASSS